MIKYVIIVSIYVIKGELVNRGYSMITIAIDEYGDFNFLGLKNDDRQNVQFIAGIVYNDMDDPQDANFERQRLDGFFRIIA